VLVLLHVSRVLGFVVVSCVVASKCY
jgi:hypothetical protein